MTERDAQALREQWAARRVPAECEHSLLEVEWVDPEDAKRIGHRTCLICGVRVL